MKTRLVVLRNRWVICAAALVLAVPPAYGVEQAAIDAAVKRGMDHLKKLQDPETGSWPMAYAGEAGSNVGATALAALALLEWDVDRSDPIIQKAAKLVREASVELTYTYSIGLSILFLDRLGDPLDVPLIESLTVRLLAGQRAGGGWGYTCPKISDAEVRRLTGLVQQHAELKGSRELPKIGEGRKRTVEDLSPEIQEQLKLINRPVGEAADGGAEDNSNTQFAVFGLWVGRRQGLPVEKALERVQRRFRSSVGREGGWGYQGGVPGFADEATPAMTCAGLLGLAVAHGVTNDEKVKAIRDLAREDPYVRGALLYLGASIGRPLGAKEVAAAAVPRIDPRLNARAYYFLWSLERVCMALDLKTICDKDWYTWGAEILIGNQQRDGSWRGEFADCGADTSFALLFLRRSNLARDLTATLRGRIKDPGEAVLRAGGVGGASVLALGIKPAIDTDAKPKPPGDGTQAGKPRNTPATASNGEAARLTSELADAAGAKQDELIARYKEGKGVVYTEALAGAIPKLTGAAKTKAREALAERLTRMTAATLRDKLDDESPEIRRAAALACAMKEDKTHLAKLIDLLQDPEPPVARAALAALKSLTNQDFGPGSDATRTERDKAIAEWKTWLSKQRQQ